MYTLQEVYMNTQNKGQFAQLKVEQRAAEKGYIVSRPTTDTRYDLIIDDGKRLAKAQIKYAAGSPGKATLGSVRVELRRWAGDKRHERRTYGAEIDILLVYVPAVDKICCIPPALFRDKPALHLRYKPAKSNVKKTVHRVDDYLW